MAEKVQEEKVVDGRTLRWYPNRRKHCDDILLYIAAYYRENGYMPNRREISENTGMVLSSVNYYLGFLAEGEQLEVMFGLSRAIKITPKGLERLDELYELERTSPA